MSDFSFVIVTDSHVDVREDRSDGLWWNRMLTSRSTDILRAAVDEINARGPDLVVHCGDATNVSDAPSFREAARLLDGLNAPMHFVPGNHDTYDPGSRELGRTLFVSGSDAFYRVERFRGWRLLFIDTVWWRRKSGAITEAFSWDDYVDIATPPEELAWLRAQFEEDDATPTLCFTHTVMAARPSYPVSRMPGGEEVEHFPVKLDSFISSPEVAEALRAQSCVKGVFYGHGHWHDCLSEDGALFCQTAALVEYPCEMRWVSVSSGEMRTEVFPLSGRDAAERSYVEEWGNRWVAGREEDRACVHTW